MRFSVIQAVASTASVASAHTIMQAVNDLEMGKGIYMPDNDNTVWFILVYGAIARANSGVAPVGV